MIHECGNQYHLPDFFSSDFSVIAVKSLTFEWLRMVGGVSGNFCMCHLAVDPVNLYRRKWDSVL